MKQALLVIDIQNDYFPGGAMELAGSPEAAQKAAQLLAAFRDKGLPVLHVQHLAAREGATFFIPGTAGAEIHPSMAPRDGERVITKHFPSCFRGTPLLDILKGEGIDTLVVVGMMTHMCVDTTVRAAFDLGFTCLLAHDACATRTLSFGDRTVSAPDVHSAYIAALNGIFAKAMSTEELSSSL
ncbi:isochorismatase [Geomonas sp. Red276]